MHHPVRVVIGVLAVAAVAVAVAVAAVHGQRTSGRGSASTLPLARGAAWYSRAVDTSAATVFNARRTRAIVTIEKWVSWQGSEFERMHAPGLPPSGFGSYSVGSSEPGFGDWDALAVHTLPDTAPGVTALLRSGRLDAGQADRAARWSPLIWLAELASMLADDPDTPAGRAAAIGAIAALPGLKKLGSVTAPDGRAGVGVAETAANLHPLLIAVGPGCASPYGGTACNGVASPSGTYELEFVYDRATDAALGLRTVALTAIRSAAIAAGTPVYQVSYVAGRVVQNPRIPPPPRPARPSVQSVPWRLARTNGRTITVHWESGTCDPGLHARPRLSVSTSPRAITLRVLVHVATGGTAPCGGVGLGGTLSATPAEPLDGRPIRHGRVTDREG